MSDKDQKKKDRRDTGKKRQRMKQSVKSRKRRASPSKQSRDEVDTVKFKPGSAGDKSRRGAP
jgi:hypothetical protein